MTVTGLVNIKVGDPLILVTHSRYRGDENVTVSRIGRVYLYVTRQDGRERLERFDRKTGVQEGNTGVRPQLMTQAQYDDVKQRDSLFLQLREAGIDVDYKVRGGLTTGQLRALLDVVQPKETP